MRQILALLTMLSMVQVSAATEVLNATDGKPFEGLVKEPRGVFEFGGAVLGGDKVAVAQQYQPGSPTSETYLWNTSLDLIMIAATRIQTAYPQDHELLKEKVYPVHEQYRKLGGKNYELKWEGKEELLVLKETNTATDFRDLSQLQLLIHSNSFLPEPGGVVRVDRHFVLDGYYLQVIAISKNPEDKAADNTAEQQSLKFLKLLRAQKSRSPIGGGNSKDSVTAEKRKPVQGTVGLEE